MDKLLLKAQKHLDEKLPFVLYAKPGSTQLKAVFQKDDQLYKTDDFSEAGFAFVSFDNEKKCIIPTEHAEVVTAQLAFEKAAPESTSFLTKDGGDDFKNRVSKGINSINKGDFKKVVLSRKEVVDLDGFDLSDVFRKLLQAYPNAFRYCWFHPKTGLWMGATPEQLLKVSQYDFQTVALAGTQPFATDTTVVWSEKEKEEQQFVTDYIAASFEKLDIPLAISRPYSFQAGNLIHIKTDITGSLTGFDLATVLAVLHPTPAVCGFPKVPAKAFIIKNEGYDREYYSGFLGELNMNISNGNKQSDLFVNLRCMKIEENQARIYVGCGITAASDPEMEFIETVNKSMTMKKVLQLNNNK